MRAKSVFMVLGLLTFATLMIMAILYLLPRGAQMPISAAPDSLPLPYSEAPIIFAEKVTLSEAQARVLYTIPLPPDVLDSASIQEVWASTNSVAPVQREVAVIFSDGIKVIVHPEDQPPDWDAIIADSPEFTKITVRGHPGMGIDPGMQEIRGRRHPYPGSVSWWVNGLLITIYSEALSLEDLLKVAESVPNIPSWR